MEPHGFAFLFCLQEYHAGKVCLSHCYGTACSLGEANLRLPDIVFSYLDVVGVVVDCFCRKFPWASAGAPLDVFLSVLFTKIHTTGALRVKIHAIFVMLMKRWLSGLSIMMFTWPLMSFYLVAVPGNCSAPLRFGFSRGVLAAVC
jgi:hypothetical protein